MIVFENEASDGLRREEYIAPPENWQHWEVYMLKK